MTRISSRTWLLIPVALVFVIVIRAAQHTINYGTSANDTTGDTLRQAFQKVNSNFTELYTGTFTNGNFGAGNGMVKVTTNLHFATNAAYTIGQVPYANATNGIGFAGNLFWDNSNGRLTVGTPAVAGPATLTVGGSGMSGGIYVGAGSMGDGNNLQLWHDGTDGFLTFGTSAGTRSFIIGYGPNSAATRFLQFRTSGTHDLVGNWRPLIVGPNKIVITDSSTNFAALAIGSGLSFDGTTLSRDALTGDVTTSGNAATIANDAVTYAKLQNISATQRALGRNTAGAGDTEEITASQLLDWIGSTRGSVLYRGASGWALLSPNTAGYVLTDGGAGADPSWAAAAGGGGGSVFVNGTNVTNPNILDGGNTTWVIQNGTNVVATSNATNDVTYNTINVQTNNFTVGKGGSLVITNFTRYPFATLTLSGTNVSAISLTNASAFKLILTANAFFGVPTDLPGTNLQQTIQIHVIQDGTGGRSVTFTNASWQLAATDPSTNAVPVISTNANAVTLFTFSTSPFTLSKLYGAVSPFIP